MKTDVNHRGFSLVELSVSLVIIGLLVTGAIAGIALIRSAELRALISEIEEYKVQIDNFKTQYEGLPGDISNASSFWAGAKDGNNNDKIGEALSDNLEVLDAWHHLYLGRFVFDEFSVSGVAFDALIGDNVPESNYQDNAGYSIAFYNTPGGYQDALGRSFSGNIITFATDNTTEDVLQGAVLTPEDAYAIDIKIDNEQPDFGKVLSENGDSAASCTTGAQPNVEYNFNTTTPACIMHFHIE